MTEPAAHRFAAPRRHRAAFTLLELLAVVFIIAILTALIMRGYVSAKGKRDEKKVEAEIKAIETAIEYYRTEYNYFPPDSFDQATGEFKPEQNGLYDNLTQHKTPGKMFKVTRERIRQIEAKALRKMRHPTRLRQLQGFLEGEDQHA